MVALIYPVEAGAMKILWSHFLGIHKTGLCVWVSAAQVCPLIALLSAASLEGESWVGDWGLRNVHSWLWLTFPSWACSIEEGWRGSRDTTCPWRELQDYLTGLCGDEKIYHRWRCCLENKDLIKITLLKERIWENKERSSSFCPSTPFPLLLLPTPSPPLLFLSFLFLLAPLYF